MEIDEWIMVVHIKIMKLHNACRIIEFHKAYVEARDWFIYLNYSIIVTIHRFMELHNSIFVP